MNNLNTKKIHFAILSIIVFLFDQITKDLIRKNYILYTTTKINNYINITHLKNKGIAFGLFNNNSDIVFYTLITISILVCIFLLHYIFNTTNNINNIAASLVLGGALGNISDKILYKGVTDFIDIHVKTLHWPAFNIADSSIFLGVLIYIIYNKKEQLNKQPLFFKKPLI